MIYIYFVFLTVFLECCYYGNGYYIDYERYHMNIDCRDNRDLPVDWWYIYKPPSGSGAYLESGGNFTYITPQVKGRLHPSRTFINHNSMLQFTLAPLYKKIYKNSLAVMSYGDRPQYMMNAPDLPASTAHGILFASSFGGVWLSHTVPNFPDITRSPPLIPDSEYKNGHLMMCLTLDIETMNKIGAAINYTGVLMKKLSVPSSLRGYLPEWSRIEDNKVNSRKRNIPKPKLLSFTTRNKTLQGKILTRGGNETYSLYKTFAKMQGIVMDVYNNNNRRAKPVCEEEFSVRYFYGISLKFPERQVSYINGKLDRMNYGVSTTADWQRQGENPHQPWTCTGYHDRQGYMVRGGLITCIIDYSIWFTFDNLKNKEPKCQ